MPTAIALDMSKLDLKREWKNLFSAKAGCWQELIVPPCQYLMIDGAGDPNASPEYHAALHWLYPVAYGMKFAAKAEGHDFVVAPLEGLWWADDPKSFVARRKDEWRWTLMIMVPNFVTQAMFATAVARTAAKAGPQPTFLRLALLDEGRCLQALHIGSYDNEGPLLADLHDQVMPRLDLDFAGIHHEIYLSDPRRVSTGRLRTILRQPVRSRT